MSYYLDSSAIVKLITWEKESPALKAVVTSKDLTSSIGRLEVLRVVDRGGGTHLDLARQVLNCISVVDLEHPILMLAENFSGFPQLRSLDAIHLATALFLQDHITAVITYDKAMADAATRMGLKVLSPR